MISVVLKTYYDNDFRPNIAITALLDVGIKAWLIGENGFRRRGGPIRLIINDIDLDEACKILEFLGEHLSFRSCPKCRSRSFEEVPVLNGNIFSKIFHIVKGVFTKKNKFYYQCKKCGYKISSKYK